MSNTFFTLFRSFHTNAKATRISLSLKETDGRSNAIKSNETHPIFTNIYAS